MRTKVGSRVMIRESQLQALIRDIPPKAKEADGDLLN